MEQTGLRTQKFDKFFDNLPKKWLTHKQNGYIIPTMKHSIHTFKSTPRSLAWQASYCLESSNIDAGRVNRVCG
jgi:hypothetical protein